MYNIGDVVVYGSEGPCVVDRIEAMTMGSPKQTKDYYILHPYYTPDSKIFAPTELQDKRMRPVISGTEATELVAEFNDLDELSIKDERSRENEYKKELYEDAVLNCRNLARIVKTIYERKLSRAAVGKKSTAVDDKYFRIAHDKLVAELSVALNLSVSQTEEYIRSQTGMQDKKK